MTKINEKILVDSGITKEQAAIYLHLLEFGMSNAKVIATKTGIGRTLTYKVLDQLVALELAEKRENIGKIALFFPSHPQKLKDLIEKKQEEIKNSTENLGRVFSKLASSYNLLLGKPNVQFYEGKEGLLKVYDDILETGLDIKLISSPIEDARGEVMPIIRKQIEKQVARNIKTRAITPLTGKEIGTLTYDDEKNLLTRKEILAEKLDIPAQIILYGDKVAITNFKESIINVVIDSKYIHDTFQKMFEYIWLH